MVDVQGEEQDEQSRNDDRHPGELSEMDGGPIRAGGILGKRGAVVIGILVGGVQEAYEKRKEFPHEQQRR